MLLNFRKRKIHIAQDHTQTLLTRGFCHIRVENLLKGLVPPLENLLLPPPPHICLSPPFSSHKVFPPVLVFIDPTNSGGWKELCQNLFPGHILAVLCVR